MPVVVALVLLTLAGAALTELFAAQRLGSVVGIESKQAFWAGEAGIWHASLDPTVLAKSKTFAGSTYTVSLTGSDYTATASRNDTTREITGDVVKIDVVGVASDPVNEDASGESAYQHEEEHFHVSVVSEYSVDAIVNQFALASNTALPLVKSLRFGGTELLPDGFQFDLPAGPFTLTPIPESTRTIAAGKSMDVSIGFVSPVSPALVGLTLYLGFTDGSSTAIPIAVTW